MKKSQTLRTVRQNKTQTTFDFDIMINLQMLLTASDEWSQKQQKILEGALVSYPKTETDRWVKIAECVPDKSVVSSLNE